MKAIDDLFGITGKVKSSLTQAEAVIEQTAKDVEKTIEKLKGNNQLIDKAYNFLETLQQEIEGLQARLHSTKLKNDTMIQKLSGKS